mmetsp:Transcript_47810/g.123424  ORF Transcript_47810/g.123424 Transcript_47810/m.123424 type:complete len:204 (-) Transcript_47810:416-1027(-)
MRVSFSSANACAVRPRKRATSTVPGKETEAKLHVLARAMITPEADCFEKKRMSSASSRSAGRPARMSLSPKAWQSRERFGRSGASSPQPVRGRSSVKHPRTEPLDREVFDRKTICASGVPRRLPPEVLLPASTASGMQNVTSSPTASRTCPHALFLATTSFMPKAASEASLSMEPCAPPGSSAGTLQIVPVSLRSFRTQAACG